MPHLRFHAIEPDVVALLSETLIDGLHALISCDRDDFTFEHIASTFFFSGKKAQAYPFVEVLWFDRGQKTQDEVAKHITDKIRQICHDPQIDVAVIFTALLPTAYYDNGEHYG